MNRKKALMGLGVLLLMLPTSATAAPPNRLRRALAEWAKGIKDAAPWYGVIDNYIRGPEGSAWAGWPRYDGRNTQWCGMYVGWALRLKLAIRKFHIPSVTRLMKGHGSEGHWAAGTGRGLAPGNRFVNPRDARPGDIGIFGPAGEDGRHIGLILKRDGNGVQTVEGNAWGTLPDGTRAEGVIRTWRPFVGAEREPDDYALLAVIRPLPSDFEGA